MSGADIDLILYRTGPAEQRPGCGHGQRGAHLGFDTPSPGSLMVIRDDGQMVGSVSGGCIEDKRMERVTQGELTLLTSELAVYGKNAYMARLFSAWAPSRQPKSP